MISPVIFVHGIQGSWLKNEYPVDYDSAVLWTGVLTRKFKQLHLHADDPRVDRDIDHLVAPHQAVPLIYEDVIDEIREEMEDRPHAYAFTYDWRKDNRIAAKELGAFIKKVLHIAGVHEKAAGRKAPQRVTLVGHSMGGLVIKWCATSVVKPSRIDKIVTIATPYGGSLKAVEALLPGARNLFGMEHKKSMRHAARTLPGLYQLLPSWRHAIVNKKTGRHMSPFSVGSWQKSLVDTLAKTYGPTFFKDRLDDARDFAKVVAASWPQELRDRVYYAYGRGSKTWHQVQVDPDKGRFYLFDKAATDTKGDGTVHELSAQRPEIDASHLFLDRPRGPKDTLIGQHANMPNHARLQDWLLGILQLNIHHAHSFESVVG
jgi:pimeloyl-ACP methyl ester carboxylesterase